jgi:hypothetical protein
MPAATWMTTWRWSSRSLACDLGSLASSAKLLALPSDIVWDGLAIRRRTVGPVDHHAGGVGDRGEYCIAWPWTLSTEPAALPLELAVQDMQDRSRPLEV